MKKIEDERFYIYNFTNKDIVLRNLNIDDAITTKDFLESRQPSKEFRIFNMEKLNEN